MAVVAVAALLSLAPVGASAANPSDGTLYVQQADGGTLTKSGGTWKLALRGPAARTTTFSDRPYRRGGSMALGGFVAGWKREFGRVAPNAALEITDGRASRDVALLELSSPRYDRSHDLLTFVVKPLRATSDLALGALARRADRGIHGSFGRSTLFVDNGDEGNLLRLEFSGIPHGSVAQLGMQEGGSFEFGPTTALYPGTPGLGWAVESTGFEFTCYEEACRGSATLAVDASPTAPLQVIVAAPEGGQFTASWAGGPTTDLMGGGKFALSPAAP